MMDVLPLSLHPNSLAVLPFEMLCLETQLPNIWPWFQILSELYTQFLTSKSVALYSMSRSYSTHNRQTGQPSSLAFPFLGPISLRAPLPSQLTSLKTSSHFHFAFSFFRNPQDAQRTADFLPKTFHICDTLAKPNPLSNLYTRSLLIPNHIAWTPPDP